MSRSNVRGAIGAFTSAVTASANSDRATCETKRFPALVRKQKLPTCHSHNRTANLARAIAREICCERASALPISGHFEHRAALSRSCEADWRVAGKFRPFSLTVSIRTGGASVSEFRARTCKFTISYSILILKIGRMPPARPTTFDRETGAKCTNRDVSKDTSAAFARRYFLPPRAQPGLRIRRRQRPTPGMAAPRALAA